MEFSFPPELEQFITNLLSTSKCSCHIINPSKTRILLWKDKDKKTYHLRIGIQKFNSQEQLDRNGEIYWRFMDYDFSPEVNNQTSLDSVTKFNHRQAKTESLNNHGEATNPPSVNNRSG